MEVSGQIHTLTALLMDKQPSLLIEKKLGGPKYFRKKENNSHQSGIERRFPRRPACCLTTVPDTKGTVQGYS